MRLLRLTSAAPERPLIFVDIDADDAFRLGAGLITALRRQDWTTAKAMLEENAQNYALGAAMYAAAMSDTIQDLTGEDPVPLLALDHATGWKDLQ